MTSPFHTHFQSFGTGPRKVLAIHCTLSHGGAWREMAQAFSERWTVVACDLPSHGKSDNWDGTSDLFDHCLRVLAPELQAPMDVIGHSFGAVVALGLAQKYPNRIRRMCLFEPVLFAACAQDAPEILSDYKTQTAPINQAFSDQDLNRAARLFNRIWGDGRRWNGIAARTRTYISARMSLVSEQEAVLCDDTSGLLSSRALASASMPMLLAHGTQSPPIAGAIVQSLSSLLPNAKKVEIDGAGHMGPITHPRAVGGAFVRFLEEA